MKIKPKKITIKPRKPKASLNTEIHRKKAVDKFSEKGNKIKGLSLAAFFLICLVAILYFTKRSTLKENNAAIDSKPASLEAEAAPALSKFAYLQLNEADYLIKGDVISQSTDIRKFLQSVLVEQESAQELSFLAEGKDITQVLQGHEYYLVFEKESPDAAQMIIYQSSPYLDVIFSLFPSLNISIHTKKVSSKIRESAGVIKTNLWEAVLDNDMHYSLIEHMEQALKWAVDFYHIQPGDRFKVVYEEKLADGRFVEIEDLHAIYFQTQTKEYYAFLAKSNKEPGFFDEYGRTMKRPFLKSPVKYGRISSHYNPTRIHPVLGIERPHLGTDYAAPLGAPVFAVADGTVTAASFTKNNGNYIKIKHDATYQTQYLHLSSFAKDIRSGRRIQQGQVIGYVGQTGLATGPHVCFRFWKNKVQVDHLQEEIITQKAVGLINDESFILRKDSLLQKLLNIPYFDENF